MVSVESTVSTAAVASTAPSADSAMTAYSALMGSSVFAAFVDFHVVISHRLCLTLCQSVTVTFRLARAR